MAAGKANDNFTKDSSVASSAITVEKSALTLSVVCIRRASGVLRLCKNHPRGAFAY